MTKNLITSVFFDTHIDILFHRQPKNMLSISKVLSDMNNVETLQQKLEAETLKRKVNETSFLQYVIVHTQTYNSYRKF